MPRKLPTSGADKPKGIYWGKDIPMRVIRRYARQVATQFNPERIILFGSYAYGTPHADSDVDILVVMPARNQIDQAYKISLHVDAPFPLDLIVRTPHTMKWRVAEGDCFLREILDRGKVLYETAHLAVATQSGTRPGRRGRTKPKSAPTL